MLDKKKLLVVLLLTLNISYNNRISEKNLKRLWSLCFVGFGLHLGDEFLYKYPFEKTVKPHIIKTTYGLSPNPVTLFLKTETINVLAEIQVQKNSYENQITNIDNKISEIEKDIQSLKKEIVKGYGLSIEDAKEKAISVLEEEIKELLIKKNNYIERVNIKDFDNKESYFISDINKEINLKGQEIIKIKNDQMEYEYIYNLATNRHNSCVSANDSHYNRIKKHFNSLEESKNSLNKLNEEKDNMLKQRNDLENLQNFIKNIEINLEAAILALVYNNDTLPLIAVEKTLKVESTKINELIGVHSIFFSKISANYKENEKELFIQDKYRTLLSSYIKVVEVGLRKYEAKKI